MSPIIRNFIKRIRSNVAYNGNNFIVVSTVGLLAGVVAIGFVVLIFISANTNHTISFISLMAAAFFAVITYVAALITSDINPQIDRKKIAIAEERFEAEPEKVRPAWDLARVTLESYFNRNLDQITAIFRLSVMVMIIGFGILVWGITQALQSQNTTAPAVIASVSGIITEFIGATFLLVYRSAIRQGMDYSKTLERINAVGMAMAILDTMPDDAKEDDLKNKTKANLIELLVRQANEELPVSSESSKSGYITSQRK